MPMSLASTAQTALQGWSRPLLLAHALCSMALAGASTHLMLNAVKLVRGGAVKPRLIRIYGQTTSVLYGVVFAWGLLVYPTYRYFVRGLYFDRYEKWASNLFDMKENWAALGLPLALALFVVARRFGGAPRSEPAPVPELATLAGLVWVTVAFAVVSGLLVTSVKGV